MRAELEQRRKTRRKEDETMAMRIDRLLSQLIRG